MADPDRSSVEVKALLRRLHPKAGNHKDRIRRIQKFRNYINADGKNTPEFYDDDVPLLLLGSVTPAAVVDPDEESAIYGLMLACGTSSDDHENMLKRSARHSMSLLKYLVCDYVELQDGRKVNNTSIEESSSIPMPKNVFAHAFCSFAVRHYGLLHLDMHIRAGHNRGAAKEDACHIITLLLIQHYAEDGQSLAPLLKEELLPLPETQREYDVWSNQSLSPETMEKIQKSAQARQNELALKERQEQLANKTLGRISEELGLEEEDDDDDASDGGDESEESEEDFDDGDILANFRRRQKAMQKEVNKGKKKGAVSASQGPALRWEDSQLYREQIARAQSQRLKTTTGGAQHHETVRESQERMQEVAEREEERAKVQGRDPLGLHGNEYDLRKIQDNQAEFMEQTLQELEERLHKAERESTDISKSQEDTFKRHQAQKESLMAIVDRLGGLDQLENPTRSILPTDSNFDPMLLLTLVHREVNYKNLIDSTGRLTNKAEDQHKQLQNLVWENFPLFVRCAEGIDAFNEKTGNQEGPGVNERIDYLETLAETSAHQAKMSFKPLLDNASEVRKVQSSLAVLNRVAPILQAPFLMRQHVENRRYSQALKAYRRVLVIDEHCSIELLNHVKHQAQKYLKETRRDLERSLAQEKVPLNDLLNGIRDLGELMELHVPDLNEQGERNADHNSVESDSYRVKDGVYDIAGRIISISDHPPAQAALLLQAAHFSRIVAKIIVDADQTTRRTYQVAEAVADTGAAGTDGAAPSPPKGGNQWKYEVMDARVQAAITAIDVARTWLPRLLQIGMAAKEDEKRRAARFGFSGRSPATLARKDNKNTNMGAYDIFVSNIAPSLSRLVEHATFCSLGCPTRGGGAELSMTFGNDAPEKLRTILRGALPPSHGTKVGNVLAELVELLSQSSSDVNGLRTLEDTPFVGLSPVDECKTLGESAVITLEKRRCIYAFEVCARSCSNKASGSGKFDSDSLLNCLKTLREQLTRPEECNSEVENGCELVIRRCCEGLASYVRERSGDDARLSAVAECADVMENRIEDVMREVEMLTNNANNLQSVILDDILGLEGAMFDEYLESIRENVANSVRVGWLDMENEGKVVATENQSPSFPAYLSTSLLSIVRCRAQVEQALGDNIRQSPDDQDEPVTYQHLAMATVADGVVGGICHAVEMRKNKLKVRQADRLANELHFLLNTLRNFLSVRTVQFLDTTRLMLCSKAGRGGLQGDGPMGLAALEDLERLGRVYVLCLTE